MRINGKDEHKIGIIEDLIIIDDYIFEKAQKIKLDRSRKGAKNPRIHKKIRILSGLLRCSECGGGMSISNTDRSGQKIGCSTRKESGSCTNSRHYYLHKIEQLVLTALQAVLSDQNLVVEYVSAYRKEFESAHGASRSDLTRMEKELHAAERARSVLLEKIANELITDDEADPLLKRFRDQAATLKQAIVLADHAPDYVEINARGIRHHRENIAGLQCILGKEAKEIDPGVMSAFRDLIAGVIVFPRERRGPYTIRIAGHLSAFTTGRISSSAVAMAERAGNSLPHL